MQKPVELLSMTAAIFRATAERLGRAWQVYVDGLQEPAKFQAHSLEEVEQGVRRLIWGYTGRGGELDLDLRIPGAIADRLYVIGQYRADMEEEVEAARGELADLGLSGPDVERVFDIGLRMDDSSSEPAQTIGCRLSCADPWEAG